MAPPPEEWLLWGKNLQLEHQKLRHRVEELEVSSARQTSLIDGLKRENHGLRDNIQTQLGECRALKQGISKLQHDHVSIKQGMLNIEAEKSIRNELDGLKQDYEALKDLMAKRDGKSTNNGCNHELNNTKHREDDFESRLGLLEGMLEGWSVEINSVYEDIASKFGEYRRIFDGLVTAVTMKACKIHSNFLIASNKLKLGKVVRRPSQVTTVVDTPDLDNDIEASTEDVLREEIETLAQGNSTWEDYVSYCQDLLERVRARGEEKVVKAFVAGIKEESRKGSFRRMLDTKGWTWKNAKTGMLDILDRRKKRYVIPLEELESIQKSWD